MATMFSMHKSERTKLRRLPFLPRIGIVVDFAGQRLTLKHAPLLETALNLRDRGFNLKNLRKVLAEELNEIRFPVERGMAAVASLKTVVPEAAKIVKKGAAKAAAAKKKAPTTSVEPEATV